jgi:uncharacterized membrane protein YbhN (UPF0104 family)
MGSVCSAPRLGWWEACAGLGYEEVGVRRARRGSDDVVFVFLLPRFADYGRAWALVGSMSWGWLAVLAACAVFDLVTFAPPWQVALPGLRFWPALAVTQASTAASLVAPAGSAVGIAVA